MIALLMLFVYIIICIGELLAIENEKIDMDLSTKTQIETITKKILEKEHNNNTYCGKWMENYQQLHQRSSKKIVYIPHTSGYPYIDK